MKDSTNQCCNCGYFRQHYIWSHRFDALDYGHCVHPPRVRHCRPQMIACEKWIPQPAEYMEQYIPSKDVERVFNRYL